jgi:hypothetical protein
MGLYLCVFASADEDDEVDGVEVGSYDDFRVLREVIAEKLVSGPWGSRFPVMMNQPDSDTEWTPAQSADLITELDEIWGEMSARPACPFPTGSWQAEVGRSLGLSPASLAESLIDVDGEPVLARLRGLAQASVEHQQPICFL